MTLLVSFARKADYKNVVQRKIISHRTLNTHKGEYIYLKSLNNEIKLDIEN